MFFITSAVMQIWLMFLIIIQNTNNVKLISAKIIKKDCVIVEFLAIFQIRVLQYFSNHINPLAN